LQETAGIALSANGCFAGGGASLSIGVESHGGNGSISGHRLTVTNGQTRPVGVSTADVRLSARSFAAPLFDHLVDAEPSLLI
jgi:hypothetical protein